MDLTTRADLQAFFADLSSCVGKGELTNGIHPYPAKFIPHIPRALIRAYAQPGGVVLDPMCGSGTTLLEAILAGHPAIGIDSNPIATMISRVKTTILKETAEREARELVARLADAADRTAKLDSALPMGRGCELPDFHNRTLWFTDAAAREVMTAKEIIDSVQSPTVRDLGNCAMSASIVAISNQESETHWRSIVKPSVKPGDSLVRIARKANEILDKVMELAERSPAGATVITADARSLPVEANSVSAVVTSPPYANAHDYYLYNKLRLFWLGYDVHEVQDLEFGSRHKHSDLQEGIASYALALAAVLGECRRVLISGGFAVLVVADAVIRGQLYGMDDLVGDLGSRAGLTLVDRFSYDHRAFNASFQRGFGTRAQKLTHVLVFQN